MNEYEKALNELKVIVEWAGVIVNGDELIYEAALEVVKDRQAMEAQVSK